MNTWCARTVVVMLLLLLVPALGSGAPPAPPAGAEVLIEVNGVPITGADIDAMIMSRHQSMDMSESDEQLLLRLLEKAINDELIVQDALAMGLDEEPELLEPVEKKRVDRAVASWVGETLEEPVPPTEAAIDAHFREHYRRIHVRQFSLRTREEAERIRTELVKGADWDEMAKVMSLDVHALKGGLHNEKYWLDLEPALQEPAAKTKVGGISAVFPYRESFSMIRVESTRPADPTELDQHRAKIVAALTEDARKEKWEAFVADLRARTPVQQDAAVMQAIRADGAQVYTGTFFNDSTRPALRLSEDDVVTESQLRRAISKQAMEMGTSTFEEILERTVDLEIRRMVLRHGAIAAGYHERPQVLEAYEADLREALINSYLNQTVAQRIRFDRDEYQQVYEENKEQLRGPDEVALSFLFLDTAEQAEQVAERLAKGADFDFVRKEIMGAGHAAEQSKYAAIDMFSEDIINAANSMAIGASSPPIAFRERWMIFRLDGRREGSVPSIETVDKEIRQVLFQRMFQEILDQHLALLKANSEIVRHEDRIRRYFASES